jgi:hypothetical protein
MATSDTSMLANGPLIKLSALHVKQTASRILKALREVSNLCASTIDSDTERDVHQMATAAQEIALQFGIQTAELRLVLPKSGEQVQIGDEYQHYSNGDMEKGRLETIDFVVVPGLQKLTQERSGARSTRTIVSCNYYPAKVDS